MGQEAVISHCSTHCGSCNMAVSDQILSDCEVLAADGTAVSGASQMAQSCAGELIDTARHEGSRRCSELQVAVITHCTSHCGSCDVVDTDAVLATCEVESPIGSGMMILGTAAVADDCRGVQVESLLVNAQDLLKDGDYDAALASVLQAVVLDPTNREAARLYAQIERRIDGSEPESSPMLPSSVIVTYHLLHPTTVATSTAPTPPTPPPAPHVVTHPSSAPQRCTVPPPAVHGGEYTVQFGGTRATLRCDAGFTISSVTAGREPQIICSNNRWEESTILCHASPAAAGAQRDPEQEAIGHDEGTRPAAAAIPVAAGDTTTTGTTEDSVGDDDGSDSAAVLVWVAARCVVAIALGYVVVRETNRSNTTLLRDNLRKMESRWDADPEAHIENPSGDGGGRYSIYASSGHDTDSDDSTEQQPQQQQARGTVWAGLSTSRCSITRT